jgi:H+/Cl- antiporter ClcA
MPARSHPGPVPMLAKLVVVAIFIGVLASLASALLYLVKDRGQSDRTVKALTMRVGISIGLLCLLVLLWALGLIQPHGIRP